MKSLKIVIIFLLLIVIALAALGVYAYLKTDLFLTPQKGFNKYLTANASEMVSFNMKPFDEILGAIGKDNTETNVYVPDSNETAYSINLVTEGAEKFSSTLNLNFLEDDELTLNIFGSKDAFGLKVEELYDKYIVVENRNLKNITDTAGIDSSATEYVPDKLPLNEVSQEDIETLKTLFIEYKDKFLSKFSDSYKIEKRANIDLETGPVTVTKYALSTKTSTLNTVLSELIEELYNDERYITVYKHINNTEPDKKIITDLKNEAQNISDEDVYIAFCVSDSKVIKTEIKIGEESINIVVNSSVIKIDGVSKTPKYKSMFTEEESEESTEYITSNYEIIIQNTYDGTSGDLTITSKVKYDDNDYEDTENIILVRTIKSGSTYNINVEYQSNEERQNVAEVNFKSVSSASIEDISSSNSTVINDFSEEDYSNLLMEIMSGLQNYVSKHPNSFIANTLGGMVGETSIEGGNSAEKQKIEEELTTGLNQALTEFSLARLQNQEADINEYLNIDKIRKYCNGYSIELYDGSTIKCTMEDSSTIYYARMDLNGSSLSVNKIDVYTESEFAQLEN